MKWTLPVISLALMGTAQAADNGFYVGVGAGSSHFDLPEALDDKDLGIKLFAGFRLLDSFAVEASYADFGTATAQAQIACPAVVGFPCPEVTHVDGEALGAFALGFVNFPLLDVFAKLGVARVEAKLTTPDAPTFNANDKKTDIAWGFGAQAHFGSLGVRGEFEQFKLSGTDQQLLSLSFVYTFL